MGAGGRLDVGVTMMSVLKWSTDAPAPAAVEWTHRDGPPPLPS